MNKQEFNHTQLEFIEHIKSVRNPYYWDTDEFLTTFKLVLNDAKREAIAEHEATNIKLSPEIFNNVQLKRVARMLKELSEESWKAAGGDGREWNTWYLKRSTQHLNQSKEGGEG